MSGPFWVILVLPVLIVGAVAVVLVAFFLIRNRLQMERAKKQASSWIMKGNIPDTAALARVHELLVKYSGDKECADILTRLDALSGRGDKY